MLLIKMLLIYGGVFFLEKDKASIKKAAFVIFLLFIFNTVEQLIPADLHTALVLAINIAAAAIILQITFKLKKINSITISAFYIAAIILIQSLLSKIPPQLFMPNYN